MVKSEEFYDQIIYMSGGRGGAEKSSPHKKEKIYL